MIKINLASEEEMLAFAAKLANAVDMGTVIFLQGPLGAGKTTFARGFLRGFGYHGKVKSPTYTLVEPYQFSEKVIFHFDLYRLTHSSELEQIGIRDYFNEDSVCLIEWPEKGCPILPSADLVCNIQFHEEQREMKIEAKSKKGDGILQRM